jgi:hypothetical protein
MQSQDQWIPEKYVVGVRNPEESEFPLGYALPLSNSKSRNEKQKDRVVKWADSYYGDTYDVFRFENEPMEGFRIVGTQRRMSSESNNGVFRVVHPVGYTFEISIEDVYDILSASTVENGTFQGSFALCRKGSRNSLIREGVPAYENMKISSNARKGEFSMSDVSLGNEIQIQRGIRGIYVGRWDVIERHYAPSYKSDSPVEVNTNRKHAILTKEGDVILHGSPNPGYIFTEDEVTYKEAGRMIHNRDGRIKNSQGRSWEYEGVTRDRGESLSKTGKTLSWEDGEGNSVEHVM